MKEYLVDVPVQINIWIRPNCQKKQFEVIKKARPSVLFIISDGGRNEYEKKIIAENRNFIEKSIDWECEIYKIYEEENCGMYTMGRKARKLVWSTVDRCIFLEDDIVPSVSFFSFCKQMLDKYENDLRISHICGMNHLGKYNVGKSDYFFSRQGSIWGFAMWKRTYEQYYNFSYGKEEYVLKLLKQRCKRNKCFWNRVKVYGKSDIYEGHIAGDEFFLELNMYAHNQLQIIPSQNLISNIGCTEDSTHASEYYDLPPGIRRVFKAQTYEIDHELNHPMYVIPDVEYEKKRNKIMGYNYFFIGQRRKVWKGIHYLLSGRWNVVVKKILMSNKKNET